jgi:hypothetical protein
MALEDLQLCVKRKRWRAGNSGRLTIFSISSWNLPLMTREATCPFARDSKCFGLRDARHRRQLPIVQATIRLQKPDLRLQPS